MKAPKMRRSVSFAAVTYVRMWLHCHRKGIALAAYADGVINADLDRHDVATPTRTEAYAAIRSIRGAKKLACEKAKLKRILHAMKLARRGMEVSPDAFHSGNGHYL